MACQPTYVTRYPPSVGPRAGASSAGTPKIPIAVPRSWGGNSRKSSVIESGNSAAPPSPCKMRKVIRIGRLHASPQSAEPRVKRVSEESCCGCRNSLGQDISGQHPLHAVDVRAESALQAWNSNVDNGLIQDAHKYTKDYYHCQYPLVIQSSAASSRLCIDLHDLHAARLLPVETSSLRRSPGR